MTPAELRRLCAYDEWANARLMEAASALAEPDQERPMGGSLGSVRSVAAHIVATEWVWLRRWCGESPTAQPEWMATASLGVLRVKLAEVEAERMAFLEGLTDDDCGRTLRYALIDGTPGERRLADLVVHVVNHSSYHRGQLADMLRRLGATPPATDFLIFAGAAVL
jgi:uncharacterized damage-inducible protein DinB